jgi:hypothetical protein
MTAPTAPTIGPDPREASQLAQNFPRNCGYAVLPVWDDGTPAIPVRNASKLPLAISNAWLRYPGPLIGIATGAVSQIWVLEIGTAASDWWEANHARLLPTRAYETRSDGLHLYYRDGDGVPNTSGLVNSDVSTHGDGGCVVHWFAAGYASRDHSPPEPFPAWLRTQLMEAAA